MYVHCGVACGGHLYLMQRDRVQRSKWSAMLSLPIEFSLKSVASSNVKQGSGKATHAALLRSP